MQPAAHENAFDLKDLWQIIRKRRRSALAFFGIVVATAAIGTFSQTPMYRASATLAILPDTPKVLNFQEVEDLGPYNYFLYQDYYNTQHKIIRSITVARRAIDRLGLTQPGPQKARVPMEPETFLANLVVEPIKESQLVRVSYDDPNPRLAALIADTVAQVYIEANLNQRIEVTRQAVEWLGKRLTDLKNQVVASEQAVYKFKSAHRIVGLDEKQNLVLQKLVDLNAAYAKTHAERIELEARWRRLNRMVQAGADREAIAAVIQSVLVQNLKQRLIELERERTELAERYLPEHPKMKRIASQVAFVRQSIDREVTKIVAAARNDYWLKQAEEQSLAEALERAKQEALELNQKLINHLALQQEAQKNQQLYDVLLGRLKETDITSSLRANNIRIIDSAEVPRRPVRPRIAMNLGLGLLLGLVGGIGLVIFLEYLDNTVKTPEDVETVLQLPLLGTIPSIESTATEINRDLYAHTHPKSPIAESCRAVRTSLEFFAAMQPLPTLLVTSATPLEGKSTLCCNLGIALAQAGRQILLVDTDLRRSRLHKAFGIENVRGFSNLLLRNADLDACLQPSGVPNLWIIPSGPLPPNPSELLSSPQMEVIAAALSARFDKVIFDSPPIIPVTDAIVLSRKVAGTIFVIKSGKVARELAAEAKRRLGEMKTQVLGVILNDVAIDRGGYAYQYQYEYGAEERL